MGLLSFSLCLSVSVSLSLYLSLSGLPHHNYRQTTYQLTILGCAVQSKAKYFYYFLFILGSEIKGPFEILKAHT